MLRRQLFVISTIAGEPPNPLRLHADAVLEYIIRTACDIVHREGLEKPGDITIVPLRGERDPANRMIDRRILEAILNSDLLAMVAFAPTNGNVFYEAGVAHAAGRPLLILRHVGFEMPFDLRQYPFITYTDDDLTGHRDGSQHPSAALAAMIRSQILNPLPRDPFERPDLGAFGGERMMKRFTELSYRDWSLVLLHARKEILLAGITLWELFNPANERFFRPNEDADDSALPERANANIMDLLAIAIARGIDVTIVTMASDNPALPAMLLQATDSRTPKEDILDEVQTQIASTARRVNLLARRISGVTLAPDDGPPGALRLTQVHRGAIPQRVTWTDLETVTTPFFNTLRYNSGGPSIRARAGHPWHSHMHNELHLLIDHNIELPPEAAAARVSG